MRLRRDVRYALALAALLSGARDGFAQQPGAGGAAPPAQRQTQATAPAPAPAAAPAASANANANATAAAPAPPDPAKMKQLLKVWEQRSAKLKTLDVTIDRVDNSPAWGKEVFKGRAILKSPNLAFLDFKKLTQSEADPRKKELKDYEQIRCTGTEVWQYRADTMQIFIFSLGKENQKRALEEGPLPFLFNMKAADAEARYQMSMVRETRDYFVIAVVPLLKIDQESFSKAFLKLNSQTYLPDRIFLVSPDGKSTKDFVLSNVRRNAPVAEANFKGTILSTWKVVREEEGAASPRAAAPPRAAAAPVRQPPPAPAGRRR
jgi:TIGR03009 family protein